MLVIYLIYLFIHFISGFLPLPPLSLPNLHQYIKSHQVKLVEKYAGILVRDSPHSPYEGTHKKTKLPVGYARVGVLG